MDAHSLAELALLFSVSVFLLKLALIVLRWWNNRRPVLEVLNDPNPGITGPATPDSAGYDLLTVSETQVLPAGSTVMLKTNIFAAIPRGYVGLIRPRSSSFKRGLIAQGTIDADYRGEIFVVVTNVSPNPIEIKYGQRIAQMILVPYLRAPLVHVQKLSETQRGSSGFGSTGGGLS